MSENDELTREQTQKYQSVVQFINTFPLDRIHIYQVNFLALCLFRELEELHHLDAEKKFWLQCASLLHDIGWVNGRKEHHKKTLEMILNSPLLLLDNKERLIIGSIARYHRKALPDLNHDHFAALSEDEREDVNKLAALLRMADGLDETHQKRIRNVQCKIKPEKIIIRYTSLQPAIEEEINTHEKSDLAKIIFNKKIELRWVSLIKQ